MLGRSLRRWTTLFQPGLAQSHPKWAYQIVGGGLHSKDDLTDKINKLGEDGWEAVGMTQGTVLMRRGK